MTAVLSSASSNSASGSGNNNASASANADADASASPANPSSNPVHRAPGNSNPQQQQQPLLSATPTVGEDGHEMVDISLAVSAGHTPQAPPTPTPEEVGFDPRVKNPRAWLNGRQFSYLLLSQAIPSMVIAGGLNAACAYRELFFFLLFFSAPSLCFTTVCSGQLGRLTWRSQPHIRPPAHLRALPRTARSRPFSSGRPSR